MIFLRITCIVMHTISPHLWYRHISISAHCCPAGVNWWRSRNRSSSWVYLSLPSCCRCPSFCCSLSSCSADVPLCISFGIPRPIASRRPWKHPARIRSDASEELQQSCRHGSGAGIILHRSTTVKPDSLLRSSIPYKNSRKCRGKGLFLNVIKKKPKNIFLNLE